MNLRGGKHRGDRRKTGEREREKEDDEEVMIER